MQFKTRLLEVTADAGSRFDLVFNRQFRLQFLNFRDEVSFLVTESQQEHLELGNLSLDEVSCVANVTAACVHELRLGCPVCMSKVACLSERIEFGAVDVGLAVDINRELLDVPCNQAVALECLLVGLHPQSAQFLFKCC